MAPKGRMWRRGIAATLAVATVAVLALGTSSVGATPGSAATKAQSNDAVTSKRAFHDGMRRLWVDHVTWTRLFIVSFVADLTAISRTKLGANGKPPSGDDA